LASAIEEQTADVEVQPADSAPAGADESLATATETPETEDTQHASPEESTTEGAGDSQATDEAPEPTTEETSEDAEKAETKSRTAKRFEKVLGDKRNLEEENRTLKAQLLQSMTAPQQPAPEPVQQRPAQPAPAANDQNSPEYWFEAFQRETDPVKQSQYWHQYNSLNLQRATYMGQQRALQQVQQQEQVKRTVDKLVDVHSRYPMFEADPASGQQRINQKAPIVVMAQRLAIQDGAPIQDMRQFLYYLREAELGLVQANRATDFVQTKRQQQATQSMIERGSLETGRGGAAKAPSKAPTESMSYEELQAEASRQFRKG
jgi:hypothetical protein